LGAGPPARGHKPSALKEITLNTTAMDWQIHCFEPYSNKKAIHFIGGYHVDEIIHHYPNLDVTVVPDWENLTILDSFLAAPLTNQECIVSYSDTVFRRDIVEKIVQQDGDVIFAVDKDWQQRYEHRKTNDILLAETFEQKDFSELRNIVHDTSLVEFTGLIYFRDKAMKSILNLPATNIGKNFRDLLFFLRDEGFTLTPLDVAGNWAEFNDQEDIAHFIFGDKANTLSRLESRVTKSKIGQQVAFSRKQWENNQEKVMLEINTAFRGNSLIIRSSASTEDNWLSSNAGSYKSYPNIDENNKALVASSINKVIESYGDSSSLSDQVLVQQFLQESICSGVVLTCGLNNGAPYYKINFDDKTSSTDSVTSGLQNELRTVIIHRNYPEILRARIPILSLVLDAVQELECLLGYGKLDVEFAVDTNSKVHIFQVRPLTVDHSDYEAEENEIQKNLMFSKDQFTRMQKVKPPLLGNKTIFSNMSDWNPAEIIGTRPKPLALSLYQNLITNDTWAKHRADFGYRDISPCKLIHSFSGQPYVDLRASINSFIPKGLAEDLSEKLVNVYLDILIENPALHDKVEFEIIFTVWSPLFKQKAKERLGVRGVTDFEIDNLESELKILTRKALGRLESDLEMVHELSNRYQKLISSPSYSLDTVTTLINDCRKFGTMAFCHAARAGFIAGVLLNDFKELGIFNEKRVQEFMSSANTIARVFENDQYHYKNGSLTEESLTEKYGHLRPGTYDITQPAYWENHKKFLLINKPIKESSVEQFNLSEEEARRINESMSDLNIKLNENQIIDYCRKSIQAREWVKFEFTKNISKALDIIHNYLSDLNIDRKSSAYLEYQDLYELSLSNFNADNLHRLIKQRKKNFKVTQLIDFPSLITNETDLLCFEQEVTKPNFIGDKKIIAPICIFNSNSSNFEGKIILIPQADPGFDWLFAHNIAGLITKYGGANSHMAIRSAEIGLLSVIGVGDKLYEKLCNANIVYLDCNNKIISIES